MTTDRMMIHSLGTGKRDMSSTSPIPNASPDQVRERLARFIGSFPAHDDDRGPDNQTLIEYLPSVPGEAMAGETFLYKLVDELLLATPTQEGYAAGLERAAQICEAEIATYLSPEYATGQPLSSLNERFACNQCADAIRAYATTLYPQQPAPGAPEGWSHACSVLGNVVTSRTSPICAACGHNALTSSSAKPGGEDA